MTPIIAIAAVAAYFILLLVIGRLASRRTSDNATFFSGGRSAPWPLVMIAAAGAAISGVTFISVPGMVVTKGWSYIQMMLGFIAGYAAIAWVLIPLFYKHGLVSIYGYLERRFGLLTYRSGAWMFFVSKMLGAGVRFMVVCAVLQAMVFGPLGLPFELNVVVSIALIWLCTAGGGVKSVIWTDVLKSVCMIGSVALCIGYVCADMGLSLPAAAAAVVAHPSAQAFHFSDLASPLWFGKQFVAGAFMVIVMTGLDQDMMQRNLACRTSAASRKNVMVASVVQFFVIGMFLMLGTLMVMRVEADPAVSLPDKTDDLFAMIATLPGMPVAVGVVFILGLVSAAYSAAGSALTSLTTSFTIDILGRDPQGVTRRARRLVHVAMSAGMALVIIVLYRLSDSDAISAVYTLASYTYGPILGLFAWGMFTRRPVADRYVPLMCLAAPAASWLLQFALNRYFGYQTGFELLLINAAFTIALLAVVPAPKAELSTSNSKL